MRLELHDVDDAAAFCGWIIERSRRKLDAGQRERLHQFLLIELWKLSLGFRPGAISFSSYAGHTLPKRIIDWSAHPRKAAAPGGGSRTARTSANGRISYVSTNWAMLSPRGQAILRVVAIPISEGYSPAQIASGLGTSTRWVSSRLDELRAELERMASS